MDEYQRKLLGTKTAMDILRKRHPVLVQDATVPVNFTEDLEEGASGKYDPETKEASIYLTGNPEQMATTMAHELTHSLQHEQYRNPDQPYSEAHFRTNPRSTLNQGAGFSRSSTKLPGEGSPQSFVTDLSKNDLMYGTSEPAAFLASQVNLPRSQQDPRVRRVIAQNPVISTMFAQQASQPNRPMPQHYKHEAEYSGLESGLNKLFGYQPTLDPEQHQDAVRSMIYRKLLREIPPRERR